MTFASEIQRTEELKPIQIDASALSLLYQVGNVIHSTLDSQEALQLIVSEAVRVMRASSRFAGVDQSHDATSSKSTRRKIFPRRRGN